MELLFKLAVSCTVVFIEVIVNLIFKLKAWHTIRFHIKFPTEFSDKNNSRHATYTLNYISTFLGPYLCELLVSESITNPLISVSALTSFIRYIYFIIWCKTMSSHSGAYYDVGHAWCSCIFWSLGIKKYHYSLIYKVFNKIYCVLLMNDSESFLFKSKWHFIFLFIDIALCFSSYQLFFLDYFKCFVLLW